MLYFLLPYDTVLTAGLCCSYCRLGGQHVILPYEVDVTAGLVVTSDFAMQRWFYCRNSACHVALLPVAALTTGLVDAM